MSQSVTLAPPQPLTTPENLVWQSGYTDKMKRIYFGRLVLYADRLVAKGWTWRGRYRKIWELQNIESVRWLHGSSKGNLVLTFNDGERNFITVKGPGTWHFILGSSLKTTARST